MPKVGRRVVRGPVRLKECERLEGLLVATAAQLFASRQAAVTGETKEGLVIALRSVPIERTQTDLDRIVVAERQPARDHGVREPAVVVADPCLRPAPHPS